MSAFCEPKNSEDHVPEALILFQKCIDEVAQRAIKLGSSPAEIKDLWKKHQTDFDKVLELFTEAFLLEDNALAALPTAVRNDNLAGTSIMPTTGPGPDHSTHSLQRATKKRKTSDSMIDLNGPEDAMAAASQGLHLPLRPAPGALQRNPSDQGHPQSDKNVPGPSDAVQNDERDFRLDTMRTHGRAVREVQNEEGRWHPDSIEDWKGNVTPGPGLVRSGRSHLLRQERDRSGIMTQRGKQGGGIRVPMRPVTPPAPDSLSVPPQKIFTHLRSTGRGAAADIKSRIRSVAELQRSPGSTQHRGGDWYEVLLQEIEHNAETCYHDDTQPSDDPTWGFPVFVMSYTSAAQEKLPQALENWIRAQELWLEQHVSHPVFRDEVIKRFKLDVVYDDSLEGASDDRIRAEFRAWMAGLGLTARGDQSPPLVGVSMSPTPKENICLVLDEANITMLAGLTFTGDTKSDSTRFEGMNVRAIDCTWRRPAELEANDTWRGIGDVSIAGLAVLFEMILAPVRGHLETGMMHHLHPLAGMPDH